MVKLDEIQKRLIREIADLHEVPAGAYNFRANSALAGRNTTANIDIISKEDGSGIDIHIKPGTVHESVENCQALRNVKNIFANFVVVV